MLAVTVYGLPPDGEAKADVYENIDFVSLVNNATYGPPALVAPAREDQSPTARPGQRVLFINTNIVPLFEIERIS